MRGVVYLLFIFGCVAVAYGLHWARRAGSVAAVATRTFSQTGSFGAAMSAAAAHDGLPEGARLSPSQKRYVETNLEEFFSLFGSRLEANRDEALTSFAAAERQRGYPMDAQQTTDAKEHLSKLVFLFQAREWCIARGVH